jgi:phosphate transport system ATP-binding protein
LVDGANIPDNHVNITNARKKIGMIAQTPNLLPMSIYDNVAYGLRIHGTKGRNEMDRTVENCLQAVGLWNEGEAQILPRKLQLIAMTSNR